MSVPRFTIYERRHHCRNCGRLYCSACSRYQVTSSGIHTLYAVCFVRDDCTQQITENFLRHPVYDYFITFFDLLLADPWFCPGGDSQAEDPPAGAGLQNLLQHSPGGVDTKTRRQSSLLAIQTSQASALPS